jgi:hypothetical protein
VVNVIQREFLKAERGGSLRQSMNQQRSAYAAADQCYFAVVIHHCSIFSRAFSSAERVECGGLAPLWKSVLKTTAAPGRRTPHAPRV